MHNMSPNPHTYYDAVVIWLWSLHNTWWMVLYQWWTFAGFHFLDFRVAVIFLALSLIMNLYVYFTFTALCCYICLLFASYIPFHLMVKVFQKVVRHIVVVIDQLYTCMYNNYNNHNIHHLSMHLWIDNNQLFWQWAAPKTIFGWMDFTYFLSFC